METTNTLQELVKSAENQNPQQSNDLVEKMASLEEGRRKRRNWNELIGTKIGRLEIISLCGNIFVNCLCDCGSIVIKRRTKVGTTTFSCGCLRKEVTSSRNRVFKRTHGHTAGGKMTKIYLAHKSMIYRCYGNSPQHKAYRDRGTIVCDRWRFGENGKTGVECFLEDMPEPEHKYLSVDRIANDGNYEPTNCRWATPYIQNNNTSANHQLEHDGVTMNMGQWEEKLGLAQGAIYHRLKAGWSVADAVTKKSRERRQTQLDGSLACVKMNHAHRFPLLEG